MTDAGADFTGIMRQVFEHIFCSKPGYRRFSVVHVHVSCHMLDIFLPCLLLTVTVPSRVGPYPRNRVPSMTVMVEAKMTGVCVFRNEGRPSKLEFLGSLSFELKKSKKNGAWSRRATGYSTVSVTLVTGVREGSHSA